MFRNEFRRPYVPLVLCLQIFFLFVAHSVWEKDSQTLETLEYAFLACLLAAASFYANHSEQSPFLSPT